MSESIKRVKMTPMCQNDTVAACVTGGGGEKAVENAGFGAFCRVFWLGTVFATVFMSKQKAGFGTQITSKRFLGVI
jgi:hypothetical protein